MCNFYLSWNLKQDVLRIIHTLQIKTKNVFLEMMSDL
jgi:hypothetical protein